MNTWKWKSFSKKWDPRSGILHISETPRALTISESWILRPWRSQEDCCLQWPSGPQNSTLRTSQFVLGSPRGPLQYVVYHCSGHNFCWLSLLSQVWLLFIFIGFECCNDDHHICGETIYTRCYPIDNKTEVDCSCKAKVILCL